MERIHNKLVRDKIPNIIESNNEVPITRILPPDEFRIELYKKLEEECCEVINASSKKEIIEELADVLEVVRTISELNGESIDEVITQAHNKRKKRGGFEKRIYLEKTI